MSAWLLSISFFLIEYKLKCVVCTEQVVSLWGVIIILIDCFFPFRVFPRKIIMDQEVESAWQWQSRNQL